MCSYICGYIYDVVRGERTEACCNVNVNVNNLLAISI